MKEYDENKKYDLKDPKSVKTDDEWMTVTCEDTFIKNAVFVNIYDDSYTNDDLLGIAANNFSKKFINLNWRWTPHRNLIAAFLANSSADIGDQVLLFCTVINSLTFLPPNVLKKDCKFSI